MTHSHFLLSTDEMYAADRAAVAGGLAGTVLMENAGRFAARVIREQCSRPGLTVVLCGPGNNGGDGFVIARLLAASGWRVRVALFGEAASLKGDAAWAAEQWSGETVPVSPAALDGAGLVVDALFGAGLSRAPEGAVADTIRAVNEHDTVKVVAIDVPTGMTGDGGTLFDPAIRADHTISFFRAKTGHWLMPGRAHCGQLHIGDIGIRASVFEQIRPAAWLNHPDLWQAELPRHRPGDHKYTRGHLLVTGGDRMTGAARLAATAAARAGAGLVTVTCPEARFDTYAASLPAHIITEPVDGLRGFQDLLGDTRRNAVLIGPGMGENVDLRSKVLAALEAHRACVLDADAITAFAGHQERLFRRLDDSQILTPHEGEFSRLFQLEGDRLSRARLAAAQSGAVIVLKGADTVIARPDGQAVINGNAPGWLATAGAGDVLAGIIAGLRACGMPAFAAACAAVWLHGEAATRFGPGLVASDIEAALPPLLAELLADDRSPPPQADA